jgi:Flp pilus assembly protein TadG
MMTKLTKFVLCQSGASAVEFALVAWPLVMMMFAGCEFGRMIWVQEALQDAAISGARCVGLLQTNCASGGAVSSSNAISYVQSEAQLWGVTVPASGVAVTASTSCGGVSGFSQVSVTYTFVSVVPLLLTLLPSGDTLTASACFPAA